ncbi:MAG TPA: DUF4097 family beta strand repeat-containing protein [Pyrinomonadaceae bacterium]|nr:DUF4097 family beta strand repeat-containing protein [Pyrinomonadaceae bacterium]
MKLRLPGGKKSIWMRAALMLGAVFLLISSIPASSLAQKKTFSRRYPASKSVRISLKNGYGTILVQAWDRDEIKLAADMDSPVARVVPEVTADSIEINVVRDNRKEDAGEVNFKLYVPVSSTVDIETRRGNITVRDVRGAMVRAHIYTSGDIELTGIRAAVVMAENVSGDILFDGELVGGGQYELKTYKGNINIRIPIDSAFRLTATAPSSRSITLGSFTGAGLKFNGDGRQVSGSVGGGGAALTVNNYQGSISFFRR